MNTGSPRTVRRARSLTTRIVLALSVATFGLAGCAPESQPEPEPVPEVLSVSAAAAVYLDAVCPVNERWVEVARQIDHLRVTSARGDADTREAAAALRALARDSTRAAAELSAEDQVWPRAAAEPVDNVRVSLGADAQRAERVAVLDAREIAEYVWPGVEAANVSGAEARAALGLPEDPEQACTARAEQAAGSQ